MIAGDTLSQCYHLQCHPRISCFRRIFPQFACRRSPARLPHASVGLDFWTIFSANIVYFRAFSSVLRKHKTKNALAGAYSGDTVFLKPRAESCERCFQVTLSRLSEHRCVSPRISLFVTVETFSAGKGRDIPMFACRRPPAHGFSFFFLERFSSFFLERRKKNAGKK